MYLFFIYLYKTLLFNRSITLYRIYIFSYRNYSIFWSKQLRNQWRFFLIFSYRILIIISWFNFIMKIDIFGWFYVRNTFSNFQNLIFFQSSNFLFSIRINCNLMSKIILINRRYFLLRFLYRPNSFNINLFWLNMFLPRLFPYNFQRLFHIRKTNKS
jgi:hypothetical protein